MVLATDDVTTADELLAVEDVAKMLNVTATSVRRYIADGALPALRLGGSPTGKLRIRRSDVEARMREWATL